MVVGGRKIDKPERTLSGITQWKLGAKVRHLTRTIDQRAWTGVIVEGHNGFMAIKWDHKGPAQVPENFKSAGAGKVALVKD